jgi:hypothetical protein
MNKKAVLEVLEIGCTGIDLFTPVQRFYEALKR